jgi:hypothetical protein
MVQLYEDMILRGKDQNARAELARKVARLWEEKLEDFREAADAWRRVLRMKSGDPEATEGLERAKAGMLNKPSKPPAAKPSAPPEAKPSAPPPKAEDAPPPPPANTEPDVEPAEEGEDFDAAFDSLQMPPQQPELQLVTQPTATEGMETTPDDPADGARGRRRVPSRRRGARRSQARASRSLVPRVRRGDHERFDQRTGRGHHRPHGGPADGARRARR